MFVNLIIPQKSFMPQSGLRAGYGKGKFSKRGKPSKPFRPAKNLPTLKKKLYPKKNKNPSFHNYLTRKAYSALKANIYNIKRGQTVRAA